MQEMIDGFLVAPFWAQVGMAFFALTFIVMLVEPGVRRRKYAARLRALAAAAGAATTSSDEFTEWFVTTVEGRPFEVRRELRVRSRGSSYRGPTGNLLVTSTPLAGSSWKLHQVDIVPGRVPKFLGGSPRLTGDEAFDSRFLVTQDGMPGRHGWLDATTRAAVTAFFDASADDGRVWVREQRLEYLVADAWRDLEFSTLTATLRQQAALATAFERAGGWRGPIA